MKKSVPERIDLTEKETEQLINRINSSGLSNDDQTILIGILHFCLWLQLKLTEAKITIRKLSKIFGVNSEKRANKKDGNPKADCNSQNKEELSKQETDNINDDKNPSDKNGKNNGRNPASQYTDAVKIEISHPSLSSGDPCPLELCIGRLYNIEPGNIIRIIGGKIAEAKNYILEKLRCNLCGAIFTAELPAEAGTTKYDARFKAHLMVYKYFLGLPFYRIERLQSYLGVPLPDSTQWHITDEIANSVYREFCCLENMAAQGKAAFGDDTSTKILAVINKVKKNPDLKRKGSFTTAIISVVGEHKIYLFYPGVKHAGENVAALLKKRNKELGSILYMCDALSGNTSTLAKEFKVIISNCLVHGRRNFIDVEPNFPEECSFVIKSLALIYKYDQEAKEQQLSAEERLTYHQKNSSPVMEQLKLWCKEQLVIIESNNGLAKAIKYMLKHWPKLTKFLEVPGASLDNNCCEEALKIPIRVRKNSYFFATEHGAFVGGMMTSLIVTAARNGANPVEYLTALQIYQEYVKKAPEDWVPWNYQDAISKIQLKASG